MAAYVFYYSGFNPIGSKGAELLSKANMPVLQELEACKYSIIKD